MQFKLEITCDNAAFGENEQDRGEEVARILREVARQVDEGYLKGILYDYNGNRVGTADFDEEELT